MTSVTGSPIVYTPAVLADSMLSNISTDEAQQARLQEELASGTVVDRPSDNPAVAADVLSLGASIARAQQYQANANDAVGWLSLGNSTMNSIVSTLQGVQQAVESLSGVALSGDPTAVQAVAAQVTAARRELLQLANTTYGGQAIFAGTGSVAAAYDANGNYLGGGQAPTRTVGGGAEVAVSVTGPSVFGSGPSGLLAANGILATLAGDVSTGTTASLATAQTTDLQALDSALGQVESQAAALGVSYQQAKAFGEQASALTTALQGQLAGEDGTDIAKVTTELTQAQQSFQSGLWAIARLQQQTLVQYLG